MLFVLKSYFTDKFKTENIEGCTYENFDIADISEFPS
jgi:shikimate dehydrogenase